MKSKEPVLREIVKELLKQKKPTRKTVEKTTRSVCKRYRLSDIPTNVQILDACTATERKTLKNVLLMKPTRTASGVTIVTVVAKPAKCPGKCIYCPKGENAPQSYTGFEPAVMRAIHNNYNPTKQVQYRLRQYRLMAHPRDKIELIIIGGTFPALPKTYQQEFVKSLFDTLNRKKSKTLEQAKKLNETAEHRCVGLAIETRPDFCFEKHINEMLELGTTRVEIGVQSIYPEILEKINRMHTIEDVTRATQLAKDSALKTTFHLMPSLPGVDFKRDLKQFKTLFSDKKFKPDSLKIYPTLVMKNTVLYDMWKSREYKPASTEDTVKLLVKAMKYIPKYCRIIRVQRDIPTTMVIDGVKKSNLRELVEKKAKNIQEIRYREAGRKNKVDFDNVELCRIDYDASGGKEIFLSFEDVKNDALIAFLRLRIPHKPFRPEITDKTALVRELHVYGKAVEIGKIRKTAFQHKGFGQKLLAVAEKISKDEFGKDKILVISGVGVRSWFYTLGYKPDGAYVSKGI